MSIETKAATFTGEDLRKLFWAINCALNQYHVREEGLPEGQDVMRRWCAMTSTVIAEVIHRKEGA